MMKLKNVWDKDNLSLEEDMAEGFRDYMISRQEKDCLIRLRISLETYGLKYLTGRNYSLILLLIIR